MIQYLINLNITKRDIMCLLTCYNSKYTLLPMKCSCKNLHLNLIKLLDLTNSLLGIEEHVKGRNKDLIKKVQNAGNSTGKIIWFQIEGKRK